MIPAALGRWADRIVIQDACWVWTGATTSRGYGQVRLPLPLAEQFGRSHMVTHRLAYELVVGPVPEGLELDHLCRNRACLLPSHLEPVDHRENVLRGVGPTAVNAAKATCDLGHELTPRSDGGRRCKTCTAARRAERERVA